MEGERGRLFPSSPSTDTSYHARGVVTQKGKQQSDRPTATLTDSFSVSALFLSGHITVVVHWWDRHRHGPAVDQVPIGRPILFVMAFSARGFSMADLARAWCTIIGYSVQYSSELSHFTLQSNPSPLLSIVSLVFQTNYHYTTARIRGPVSILSDMTFLPHDDLQVSGVIAPARICIGTEGTESATAVWRAGDRM